MSLTLSVDYSASRKSTNAAINLHEPIRQRVEARVVGRSSTGPNRSCSQAKSSQVKSSQVSQAIIIIIIEITPVRSGVLTRRSEETMSMSLMVWNNTGNATYSTYPKMPRLRR